MKITEQDYPLVAEYRENEMHVSVKKTIDIVYIYRDKSVYSFTLPIATIDKTESVIKK